MPYNTLSSKAYLIYLRKSRADNPDETVEEVLAKHEILLQELAVKELGFKIPEQNIFREVVSGETIEERPEINRVLELISNPAIEAVLVVEPQRLSRGDLEDCGRIVNAFRYSKTKVMTTQMTYDLTDKMHRKFFEQELVRGNDFLEYTKEILYRGRRLSVESGNFLGNCAPFGYDKTVIKGGPSLKENENGDAVRLIFDMYVNQNKNYRQIADHLNDIGVKPMRGEQWEKCSIKQILSNIHYIGFVKYGVTRVVRQYENGKTVKKRTVLDSDHEEIIIAKGKHEPIITKEIYEAAQEKLNQHPRHRKDTILKNPLAGVFFCHRCGKSMARQPYKHARARYECGNRKNRCGSRSAPEDEVLEAVIYALENEKLPELEVKLQNGDGTVQAIQQKQLAKLKQELADLKDQEKMQYVFLEKKVYTPEEFAERKAEVKAEMDEVKSKIYNLSKEIPKEVNYKKEIVKLQDAIAGLKDNELPVLSKNMLIKSIVERIEYEYIRNEGRKKVIYRLHIKLLV